MKSPKPTLLIISATIRRDLHRPLRHFRHFRVVHVYRDAAYGDLDRRELRGARCYRSIDELRALIAELGPDLIQGPEPVASRLMLRVAWLVWRWHRTTGRPYFFPMFENRPLRVKFGPFVGRLMAFLLEQYARDAAWIYVLNEGARTTLAALGIPPAKVIRANWGNWGIDRTAFNPARSSQRAKQPIILFVGRLSVAKGLTTLLDAFGAVRTAEPTAELWLVGPTDLDVGNRLLIERARQSVGVVVRGSVKHRALPVLFHQAWVSVLLSQTTRRWAEQVGMVALQSLACGTPVVVTDSGSIGEYVGLANGQRPTANGQGRPAVIDSRHGALVVPEADPASTAEAILTILRDRALRERMERAGVRWIRDTFDEAMSVPALDRDTRTRWRQWQREHGGES